MEFVKYHRIENANENLESLQKYLTSGVVEDEEWVALEKIDGANFQFYTDGNTIKCCSRNRELDSNSDFHNFQDLLRKYEPKIRKAFLALKKYTVQEYSVVRLYGEIFGGYYPPREKGRQPGNRSMEGACARRKGNPPHSTRPVQKRVAYLPYIDFYLFDVCYTTTSPEPKQFLVDVDDVVSLAGESGFLFVATPLHRGTLSEMMSLSPTFTTTIPALAGLRVYNENIAEGYVIRPAKVGPTVFKMKLKQEAFCETKVGPLHGPQSQTIAVDKMNTKAGVLLSENEMALQLEIVSGLTTNRLYSVMSKYGAKELDQMHGGRLAALLLEDAVNELESDRDDLRELFRLVGQPGLIKIRRCVFDGAESIVRAVREECGVI